jgi:hypothetical protein
MKNIKETLLATTVDFTLSLVSPVEAWTSVGTWIAPKSIKIASITEIIMRIIPIVSIVYPKVFSIFSALFCGFMKNENTWRYKNFIPKLHLHVNLRSLAL